MGPFARTALAIHSVQKKKELARSALRSVCILVSSMMATLDSYLQPDPQRTALLTIDVQNDFVLLGAVAEIVGSAAVVPQIGQLVGAFRVAGRPIVHVVRLYRPDGSNADVCRRRAIEQGRRVVIPGSDGAELAAGVTSTATRLEADKLLAGHLQLLGPGEWAIYKPRWSAFYATALDEAFAGWGVNSVVVCGCNFPNCPRATVYDASQRDLRVVLVRDATSGLYDRGESELKGIGVQVVETDEVVTWIAEAARSASRAGAQS